MALQEAQKEAVQAAAFSVYNSEAVGTGPVRRNKETLLHADFKRQFEVSLIGVRNDSSSFGVDFRCVFEAFSC